MNKQIHIFGGGTVEYIKNHFAISAPAYGKTARALADICERRFNKSWSGDENGKTINRKMDIYMWLTKMCYGDHVDCMDTSADVAKRVKEVVNDKKTKIIFFSCAIADFTPHHLSLKGPEFFENGGYSKANGSKEKNSLSFGKKSGRIKTSDLTGATLELNVAPKIIKSIREKRKDIFLVGFKTTCGATKQQMFEAGLGLCKGASVNLVLVNDVETRWNMIVTPEEATYCETDDRNKVLTELVDMTFYRSHLTFTQSTVVAGDPVPWNDPRVPDSLRKVVDYCISKNAYKAFNNATVGHFAVKLSDTEFLTSIRKSNFNHLDKTGLVYVKTDGPDTVLAYGAKPSVGGQSQRIVFRDHPGMDCIVHFHCPLKETIDGIENPVPVRSQREIECGSHQCGKNTSDGLMQFGNLKAVYLEQHGPNIVFNHDIDPQEVIDFIETNFDLSKKTGGYRL